MPDAPRRRDFDVFWLGQTLSSLGDGFAFIALPLLVLEVTGSVAKMGLVTAISGVGQVLVGLLSGALMDRLDRRRVMIVCDIARAGLFALIPLGWMTVGPSMALVYAVTALGSALSTLFSVGYVTAIPSLVGPERVTEANGRLTASMGVCFVVGPALAGLVSAKVGPAWAVGVDALSFIASALSLATIRFGRVRSAPAAGQKDRGVLDGVRFLVRHPVLRPTTVYFSAIAILGAGVLDLLVFLLKRELHEGDGAVGVVMGLGAVGAALGGLVAAPSRRRFGFGVSFLGASVLQGLAIAGMGLSWASSVAVGCAALWSAGMTVRGVVTMSLRQQITPDHLLGRVTATFWTLGFASAPLGAALATWIAEHAGVRPVLVVTGTLLLVVTGLAGFTPLRLARPESVVPASLRPG
jgi:MFS family permease